MSDGLWVDSANFAAIVARRSEVKDSSPQQQRQQQLNDLFQ